MALPRNPQPAIEQALRYNRGNVSQAARALGIPRTTLNGYIAESPALSSTLETARAERRADTIIDRMSLSDSRVRSLRNQIEADYIDAYRRAIGQLLEQGGVTGGANSPSGSDLQTLQGFVDRDIESIVNTYNRELENQARRLTSGDPSLTLAGAKLVMGQWHEDRDRYKTLQIVRASRSNAAEYARERFFQENRITGSYTWDATPPIVVNSHLECIRRVRAGVVSAEEAKDWRKTHPNCRHIKKLINPYALDPRVAWRG